MTYIIEPDPRLSMPSGVTVAQARAIQRATSVSTYTDGDYDFIVIVTRLGGEEEGDGDFFIDAQWIRWIQAEYEGWSFIDGDGQYDTGGEWFAQWQRLGHGDPGIWVALGRRQRLEEAEV